MVIGISATIQIIQLPIQIKANSLDVIRRPFLKWAGGKSRLIPRINKVLPEGNRLIEPFMGSAAVFLNTDFDRYLLADINPDLINLFQFLKKGNSTFIDISSEYFSEKNNTEKVYYALREHFNSLDAGKERAALFLYLNRHGYNGLCRYNQKGIYNVPFGRFKRPYFPAKEMEFFAQKAKRATFVCEDFRKVMQRSRQGNVIYCDPPYVAASATAYFTQYAHQSFTPQCQQDLAESAKKSVRKGVKVIISNHDNAVTRRLYEGATIHSFYVQRNISCDGEKRKKVKELLACY